MMIIMTMLLLLVVADFRAPEPYLLGYPIDRDATAARCSCPCATHASEKTSRVGWKSFSFHMVAVLVRKVGWSPRQHKARKTDHT